MQDKHLCSPRTFSLAPHGPPHFFHSRIATVYESACLNSQSLEGAL